MTITTTEQILLIILSTAFAVFLIIGIIALIKIVQLLNHIKHIVEKAEQIADKAEHVTEFFQKSAGTVAIGKLISNIFNSSRERKGRKDT
jgi:hypothetical protein